MENEDILMQMVKDNMAITVVDPTDYSEVVCHVEGKRGDFHLASDNAQAPDEDDPFGEPEGFIVPIRRLIVDGTSEMYFICDGFDDALEVVNID